MHIDTNLVMDYTGFPVSNSYWWHWQLAMAVLNSKWTMTCGPHDP